MWFSRENLVLLKTQYRSATFDFFINWTTESVEKTAWIKRTVKLNATSWPTTNYRAIEDEIFNCDGQDEVTAISRFLGSKGINLTYKIFPENVDWRMNPVPILNVSIGVDGKVANVGLQQLSDLQSEIRRLSGGPVRIGTKGLFYGTSSLECYLSTTDALWPGDVDMFVFDEHKPVAILEYKKHNLETPIEEQQLSNYYPRPDGRKYKRLALLRDYFGSEIPIVILYYPTKTHIQSAKLEKISGDASSLRSKHSEVLPLPTIRDRKSQVTFVESVLAFSAKE